MPSPGDRLADRYTILAPLGSGGMATVHRAHDDRLDRDVAIKVLLPNLGDDPVVARRFAQEGRAMAAVAHPGLVAVFDVDPGNPDRGQEPFVVMELCPGGSLDRRLETGRPMPPDELVPIVVAVADGLAALHQAGLVHRDVKPSNILFASDRVKLGDFGLVRGESGDDDLTDTGLAIGTLAYLPPERLRGERGGPPSDVYALATVVHRGLTGEMPRPSGSLREVVTAAVEPAPLVSSVAPWLGTAFDRVVSAGLDPDPAARPDALSFATSLTSAFGAWRRSDRSVSVRPPSPQPDDTTTAIPISAQPVPLARQARSSGSGRGLILGASIAVAVYAAFLLLGGTGQPPGSTSGPSSTPSASASIGTPSTSPSLVPSASPSVVVSPTPDPARAALDAVRAAIEQARGGPDGLKGKQANQLSDLAGRVATALDAADRKAALDAAGRLERAVDEATKNLNGATIDRLRAAANDLVAVLRG